MKKSVYKQLLTYSYNIVGSYEDAKDLVQDTMEKYITLDKSQIQHETNYLIKSVVNRSINFKQQHTRIAKYGVWLPEPLVTESADSRLVREHTAGYSLLVLMEKLNARERAVFILREAFDYSHEEIAGVLDVSVSNARQLYSRAKKSLQSRAAANAPVKPGALDNYINALINGDVKKLETLLRRDVQVHADGGNKVRVITGSGMGRDLIIERLLFVYRTFKQHYTRVQTVLNHQPAICFYDKGKLVLCQVFALTRGKITDVYAILDADKLKNIIT